MLIFGKALTKNNKDKIGGVIVLYEKLKTYLKKENIIFSEIDLNYRNYQNKFFWIFAIYFNSIIKIKQEKNIVFFNGTANEFKYIAPWIVFWVKIFNKKIVLRKFAGNFDEYYKNSSFIGKYLIQYVLKNGDVVFFETKYLIEFFKKYNKNTFWFPNVRDKSKYLTKENYEKKFVFIGHVKKEKGIGEILKVFKSLDKEYIIDIYGPLIDYKEDDFKYNVNYKGILKPDEVQKVLANYNYFVFPTFYKGEGYPGVIIEALSVGLPIIATDLKGIKEMVNGSAFLIPKKDVKSLKNTILMINEEKYKYMRKKAVEEFDKFDNEKVTKKVFEIIEKVCDVKIS